MFGAIKENASPPLSEAIGYKGKEGEESSSKTRTVSS